MPPGITSEASPESAVCGACVRCEKGARAMKLASQILLQRVSIENRLGHGSRFSNHECWSERDSQWMQCTLPDIRDSS
jgi:hypothetical protein